MKRFCSINVRHKKLECSSNDETNFPASTCDGCCTSCKARKNQTTKSKTQRLHSSIEDKHKRKKKNICGKFAAIFLTCCTRNKWQSFNESKRPSYVWQDSVTEIAFDETDETIATCWRIDTPKRGELIMKSDHVNKKTKSMPKIAVTHDQEQIVDRNVKWIV